MQSNRIGKLWSEHFILAEQKQTKHFGMVETTHSHSNSTFFRRVQVISFGDAQRSRRNYNNIRFQIYVYSLVVRVVRVFLFSISFIGCMKRYRVHVGICDAFGMKCYVSRAHSLSHTRSLLTVHYDVVSSLVVWWCWRREENACRKFKTIADSHFSPNVECTRGTQCVLHCALCIDNHRPDSFHTNERNIENYDDHDDDGRKSKREKHFSFECVFISLHFLLCPLNMYNLFKSQTQNRAASGTAIYVWIVSMFNEFIVFYFDLSLSLSFVFAVAFTFSISSSLSLSRARAFASPLHWKVQQLILVHNVRYRNSRARNCCTCVRIEMKFYSVFFCAKMIQVCNALVCSSLWFRFTFVKWFILSLREWFICWMSSWLPSAHCAPSHLIELFFCSFLLSFYAFSAPIEQWTHSLQRFSGQRCRNNMVIVLVLVTVSVATFQMDDGCRAQASIHIVRFMWLQSAHVPSATRWTRFKL